MPHNVKSQPGGRYLLSLLCMGCLLVFINRLGDMQRLAHRPRCLWSAAGVRILAFGQQCQALKFYSCDRAELVCILLFLSCACVWGGSRQEEGGVGLREGGLVLC